MTDPMTPTRPSEPAVNEAAERLHNIVLNQGAKDGVSDSLSLLLDEALATERRNTVERIRARLPVGHQSLYDGIESEVVWRHDVDAILDEAAA